jgi:hypothetical protein
MDATWVSSDRLELFTDASGQIGYGAVFGSSRFYGVSINLRQKLFPNLQIISKTF